MSIASCLFAVLHKGKFGWRGEVTSNLFSFMVWWLYTSARAFRHRIAATNTECAVLLSRGKRNSATSSLSYGIWRGKDMGELFSCLCSNGRFLPSQLAERVQEHQIARGHLAELFQHLAVKPSVVNANPTKQKSPALWNSDYRKKKQCFHMRQ